MVSKIAGSVASVSSEYSNSEGFTPQYENQHPQKEETPTENPGEIPAPETASNVIAFPGSETKKPETAPAPKRVGITHTLLAMMSALQEKKGLLSKWVGNQAYEKKSGQTRKGIMVDTKVD